MTAVTDLQRQCHSLLNKLKTNQLILHQDLSSNYKVSSLENNLKTQIPEKKPEYARQKLKSIMKNRNGYSQGVDGLQSSFVSINSSSGLQNNASEMIIPDSGPSPNSRKANQSLSVIDKNGKSKLIQGEKETDINEESDVMQDYFRSRTTESLLEGGTDSFLGAVSSEDNTQPEKNAKPGTPTSIRRRRIIDRHVHVDSKLSDADLKDLEKDATGLNFSYSQALENENSLKQGHAEHLEDCAEHESDGCDQRKAMEDELTYQKKLVDRGNNRQLNNFIRDTTIKPKSLLNATQSFSSSYSKQGPGVSFQSASSTSGTSSLFRNQAKERRMLGYDWIAALIGNDSGMLDESESFFQELREFRRNNRDECCNDFYMEGPFTLTETEPPEVEKAIKDTKVQPFTVNERLFTVPVTENLLGQPLDPDRKEGKMVEPTQENPRFVRVSIPRATLQMPYKVRPHRRRSFDSSDSCSLREHCLMGWNAVSPATLPTASSVSLTDAMTGANPKHTTTLADAEKVASTFHWPILADPRPKSGFITLPRKHTDASLNLPLDMSSLSLSASLGDGRASGPGNSQRRTDELLNSTYSMMYEMQKARERRELEKLKQSGRAAS